MNKIMRIEGITNIYDLKNSIPFIQVVIQVLVITCIVLIVLIIVGFLVDYVKRNDYSIHKSYYRTLSNETGGGEEYYYKYWLWQPNKKKYLVSTLEHLTGVPRVYSRKARKRKKQEKTWIPFRREIYCKVR